MTHFPMAGRRLASWESPPRPGEVQQRSGHDAQRHGAALVATKATLPLESNLHLLRCPQCLQPRP